MAAKESIDPVFNSVDITEPEMVEVLFDKKRKVLWINTETGCKLRACRIKKITFGTADAEETIEF